VSSRADLPFFLLVRHRLFASIDGGIFELSPKRPNSSFQIPSPRWSSLTEVEPFALPVGNQSSSSTSPGSFLFLSSSLLPSTTSLNVVSLTSLLFFPLGLLSNRHDPPLSVALPHPPTSVSLHPFLRDRFIAGSTNDPWVRVYDLDTATERECYKGSFDLLSLSPVFNLVHASMFLRLELTFDPPCLVCRSPRSRSLGLLQS